MNEKIEIGYFIHMCLYIMYKNIKREILILQLSDQL